MSYIDISMLLKIWKDAGLYEVLQGYPNAVAVRYLKNYTPEVLRESFTATMSALKEGRLQKRDVTLLESACRYATGVAKNNTSTLDAIQKEIDRAVAKENIGHLPIEQIRI